jgi:hypothetical protein
MIFMEIFLYIALPHGVDLPENIQRYLFRAFGGQIFSSKRLIVSAGAYDMLPL